MYNSLSPFHSAKLPTEICEAIIGFVDEDVYFLQRPYRLPETKKALYSCALVCRSWITRARIHLFRIVTIDSRSVSNIMTVVLTSPTHGSYVQRVDLSGHDQPLDPQTNIPRHDGWIYDFFKKVVPLLPNLTFIQYDGLPTLHPCFYISPPRVPSLTSLSLSGLNATSIGDVLRLISYYKRLKELYITQSGGAWGPFSNHHYSFGQRWSCHLQVLSIQRCTVSDIFDLFHWLAQLRTPCSFEHLVLTWGYGRHSRDLERAPMRSIPEHIALGWARTLKSLSLDFLLEPDDESPLFKSILVCE